jgi:hypothetical protein
MNQSEQDAEITEPRPIPSRVSLDIILSLLRPGELEKLGRYVDSYLVHVRQQQRTEPLIQEE